jgi:hypothetical protein
MVAQTGVQGHVYHQQKRGGAFFLALPFLCNAITVILQYEHH